MPSQRMQASIEVTDDLAALDAAIELLPNHPAVFALWPKEGEPYLGKTALLRRRLLRLLRDREKPSRLLNLRHTVARIEYRLTGSSFESAVVHYEQARRLFPERYLDVLKLRMPPYVKVVLNNEFPRSHITTHLTRTAGSTSARSGRAPRPSASNRSSRPVPDAPLPGGPDPTPEHPGCIYGEMGMCLRPCQEVVGPAEYRAEVDRVVEFLRTDGHSLVDAIARSRDRLSEEMMFEEAARQHKRLEKVQETLEAPRRAGARRRPAERRRDHAVAGAGSRRDVVPARRQLDGAAPLHLRSQERQAGLARPQAARDLRRGRARASSASASGRSIWRYWPAGITRRGARANGCRSKARSRRIASS
jgi:hypothetical protein